MVSFAHHIALFDNDTLGPFDRATHVGLQFGTHHSSVSVDSIDFSVIVKQNAQVVDTSFHVVVFPWAADVLAGEALQPFSVHIGVEIKGSIMMTDTGCPDTLAVNLFTFFQAEGRVVKRVAVETITYVLPVHQILGVEDNEAGHRVHGRTGQIIVIAHTDDVRVRKLIIK